MKTTVLIVEDDICIHNMIKDLLRANGFLTVSAYSGTEALLQMGAKDCDMVLLDLMLPGMNGENVISEIRKESNIPVIALTSKDDKESKLIMFKNGVDDYITKPFDVDEFIWRINAVLKRYSKDVKEDILTYKDLTLNQETLEVKVGDKDILLTKLEFSILKLLMSSPKKVFSKNNIYSSVWNDDFFGEENAINVHISNLRAKLALANGDEQYIQTVWGIGFKMM